MQSAQSLHGEAEAEADAEAETGAERARSGSGVGPGAPRRRRSSMHAASLRLARHTTRDSVTPARRY